MPLLRSPQPSGWPAGSFVVWQDHLLPEEYVSTMKAHMLDRCPVSSWSEVQQIITEDLGAPPDKLFKQFSPTPIASASLAQVAPPRPAAARQYLQHFKPDVQGTAAGTATVPQIQCSTSRVDLAAVPPKLAQHVLPCWQRCISRAIFCCFVSCL